MNGKDRSKNASETMYIKKGGVNPGGRSSPESGPEKTLGVGRPADYKGAMDESIVTSKARPTDAFTLDFESLRGSAKGLGPFLPFVIFAFRLRDMPSVDDPGLLRSHTETALRKAVQDLSRLGWDPASIELAKYFVCCAVDEAAQSTPWGRLWAARPLIASLAQNAIGGERFFDQLDTLLRQPSAFDVRVLKVAYACLQTGFRGQFGLQRDQAGDHHLAMIKQAVLDAIRSCRTESPEGLFSLALPLERPPLQKATYFSLGFPLVASAALLALVFVAMRFSLASGAGPIIDGLSDLGRIEIATPKPPVQTMASATDEALVERVRSAAQRGNWSVESTPGKIVIVVSGGQSFSSGSARLGAQTAEIVEDLGRVLSSAGGAALVRGHSDSQPIRSFDFQSNAELSRARAAAVSEAFSRGYGRAPPIEGLADRMVLCTENSPDCHRRNRRVEIEYSYGGGINDN